MEPKREAIRIVREVSGRKVLKAEVKPTGPPFDLFGPMVTVWLDADAREALEVWIKAARRVRGRGFILEVQYAGRTNVTTQELIAYVSYASTEMGIPFFIGRALDPMKAVRESGDRGLFTN